MFIRNRFKSLINYLLKINPKKIIISTNQELNEKNGGVGNDAAIKIYNRLRRYFNTNQLLIKLPYKKDFCVMECDSIKDWYNNRYT